MLFVLKTKLMNKGQAIAQVVSHQILTTVQSQFSCCGVCGGQIGTAAFSKYFSFLFQFSFHQMLHFSWLSFGAGT
jgi:hypothetical protein